MAVNRLNEQRNAPSPRTDRYAYIPRQRARIRNPTGMKLLDSYLECDCLLTEIELERLSAHQYSAVDTSWLDELCMKRFWEWIVRFYPIWLAPNLITLIGLIVNLLTVLILAYYCPTATEQAPAWVYLQAAFGLFVFQTLDATDGKQARRTGSSSPLGELFDHGCDSVSQVFVTLNICYALQLGQMENAVMAISVIAVCLFYWAHWSTYCSGELKFARFDVTEAQMTVIGMLVATAIFGPHIWTIGIFGLELRHLLLAGSLLGTIYQGGSYLIVIMTGGVGKNGSTVAGTSVIFPVFPLLALIVPFCMIYSKSTTTVLDENIGIFVLLFGAVAAKTTNRIIVAYMSRSELELWDCILLAPGALMLNQYYDTYFDEYKLLIYCTVYAYSSLFIYCVSITNQISDHLGIYVFTLSPRPKIVKRK